MTGSIERRADIVSRLQTTLAANERRLSPSSRRAIYDAIGELSPVDPAAASGLMSTNLGSSPRA